jgi:hypothetical protein
MTTKTLLPDLACLGLLMGTVRSDWEERDREFCLVDLVEHIQQRFWLSPELQRELIQQACYGMPSGSSAKLRQTDTTNRPGRQSTHRQAMWRYTGIATAT